MYSALKRFQGFNNLDFSKDKDLESVLIIPNSSSFNHLFRDDYTCRNAEGLSCGSFNPETQDIIPYDSRSYVQKFIQMDRFNLHFVRQGDGGFSSELFTQISYDIHTRDTLGAAFVRIVEKAVTFTLESVNKWMPDKQCGSFSLTFDWIIKTQVQNVKISPIEYLIVPILGSVPVSTSPTYGQASSDDHFYEMTNLCIPSTTDGLFMYARVNLDNGLMLPFS